MSRNSYWSPNSNNWGEQRRSMSSYVVPAVLIAVALGIGTLIFLGVHTTEQKGCITRKTWERTQEVQVYDWVRHSEDGEWSYPSVPIGARNVKRWTDTRRWTDSDGDTHRDTDYNVSYEIQEWGYGRSVTDAGNQDREPVWPIPTLNSFPPERLGARHEKFSAEFMVTVGQKTVKKTYSTSNFNTYLSLKLDYPYVCVVNGFGALVKIKDLQADWTY